MPGDPQAVPVGEGAIDPPMYWLERIELWAGGEWGDGSNQALWALLRGLRSALRAHPVEAGRVLIPLNEGESRDEPYVLHEDEVREVIESDGDSSAAQTVALARHWWATAARSRATEGE